MPIWQVSLPSALEPHSFFLETRTSQQPHPFFLEPRPSQHTPHPLPEAPPHPSSSYLESITVGLSSLTSSPLPHCKHKAAGGQAGLTANLLIPISQP